jgi:autotransporter-associated beta strand protein
LTAANDSFTGVIAGTGGVTLSGGTQTLAGANTYSGGTIIQSGEIAAGLDGANINGTVSQSFGTGSIYIYDGATLNVAGRSISNNIFAEGRGKQIDGVFTGAITNGRPGNPFDFDGGYAGAKLLGVLTLSNAINNEVIIGNRMTLEIAGKITGAGRLTKIDGHEGLFGHLFITNSTNDYTGGTTISSGKLWVGSSGSAGVIPGNIINNAYLIFNSSSNLSYSGVISGTGQVANNGTGVVTLTGINTYTGVTNINAGSLALSGSGSMETSSKVVATGTFDISGTTNGASIKSLDGSGNVSLGAKTLTLAAANDSFTGVIAGTGGVNLSGGTQTLSGDNTYQGNTELSSGVTLILGHRYALGLGSLYANNATLRVSDGVELNSLTAYIPSGTLYLATDLRTIGSQIYNGDVTIVAGNQVNDNITPMVLSAQNSNITFNGRLLASNSAYSNRQSLDVDVGTGVVTFNDRVGAALFGNSYISASFSRNMPNLFNLVVTGGSIVVKADITTYGTQTYNGEVLIGDNGSNGLTRTFLSIDPAVTFNGTVNDLDAGVHDLQVLAITTANLLPSITFNDAVGNVAPLNDLSATVGVQSSVTGASVGEIPSTPASYFGNMTIASSVSTAGSQTYTANQISLGSAGSEQQFSASDLAFKVGVPANSGSLISTASSTTVNATNVEGLTVAYTNSNASTSFDSGQMFARYQEKNTFDKDLYGSEFGDVDVGTAQEIDCQNNKLAECK